MDQFTVVGGSQKDIRTFYSTLYRLLLFPHNIPESGRYMSPYDGKVHAGQISRTSTSGTSRVPRSHS